VSKSSKAGARRRKGFAHSLTAGKHTLIADEPPEKGGTDAGPEPTQLLALSLAACTAITVEMYAERKEWDVGDVAVDVDYQLDPKGTSRFDVLIEVPGDVSEEQLGKLQSIASRCPVHRVLTGDVEINDEVRRA
jgi:putative redox protein